MNFNDPNELAERYTAVWMEPDGDRRRKAIADLWSEDAIHFLQPTQEVYEAADERAVNPTWQVRGHDELEARVTSAFDDSWRPARCLSGRGTARNAWGMWSLGAGKESHRMARCSAPASSS